MGHTPEWDEGYEVGYREGAASLQADYVAALDGLIDDPTPLKVAVRIERLEGHIIDCGGSGSLNDFQ